jgi:extradiol dioxygenase family protein
LVVFAGDFEAHVEIVFGLEIVDDHLGVVVDVDDGFGYAEGLEAGESDFEEGAAVEFD